jgi:hypothetical protein
LSKLRWYNIFYIEFINNFSFNFHWCLYFHIIKSYTTSFETYYFGLNFWVEPSSMSHTSAQCHINWPIYTTLYNLKRHALLYSNNFLYLKLILTWVLQAPLSIIGYLQSSDYYLQLRAIHHREFSTFSFISSDKTRVLLRTYITSPIFRQNIIWMK